MKISSKTLDIIKNFATINTQYRMVKGNFIATAALSKNISARTTVPEEFPADFNIYDLTEFLGCISLFPESPEISINDDGRILTMTHDRQTVEYVACVDGLAVTYPFEKGITFVPDEDIKIQITPELIGKIIKSASTLHVLTVSFYGNAKDGIYIKVWNNSNLRKDRPFGNTFVINITNELPVSDLEFETHMSVEHLKLIPGNYELTFSGKDMNKTIGRFESTDEGNDLTYFISCIPSSSEFRKGNDVWGDKKKK